MPHGRSDACGLTPSQNWTSVRRHGDDEPGGGGRSTPGVSCLPEGADPVAGDDGKLVPVCGRFSPYEDKRALADRFQARTTTTESRIAESQAKLDAARARRKAEGIPSWQWVVDRNLFIDDEVSEAFLPRR